MTPEEYWNLLESEIKKFDEKNFAASNNEDKEEYKKQKDTLLEVASIAHEANQCWTPAGKKECLQKAETLVKDKFGVEGLPAIVGKKTRDFIESVYIPHLKARKDIDFGLQGAVFNAVLKLAGSSDTLEVRILKAQIKAEILTKKIKDYDDKSRLLNKQAIWKSPSSLPDYQEINEKEVKSLSPC